MKTSLHRIYTKDFIELVGLLYQPEIATRKILVHVHGMAGNFYENGFLDFIAKTLTDNGIAFFAFNNRGCEYIKDFRKIENGKRETIRLGNAYEKFEESALDIQGAIDFAESKGFMEIHLSGHSLGAPKVAYYTAEAGDSRVKSVIFLSPADMVGLARVEKDFEENLEEAKNMIAKGEGNNLIPHTVWDGYWLSANSFIDLSSKESKVAIFNLYDPEDDLSLLGKITIPTLIVMGTKDEALTVTIEGIMGRVKKALALSPGAEAIIIGEADHGYLAYEQKLADTLNTWIQTT